MAVPQLVLPAGLRRIERQKADQRLGMRGDIVGNVLVIDPQPGEACLAAEDDRPHGLGGGGPIVLVADGQIDHRARPGPAGLLAEIVREVLRKGPGVAVNVDDHRGTLEGNHRHQAA